MSNQQSKPVPRKFWLVRSPAFELHLNGETQRLWQKLTRREKQIARLAGARLTDAEIAAALVISEKTVGNHLVSIFAKLEIHSRHEIKYLTPQTPDADEPV